MITVLTRFQNVKIEGIELDTVLSETHSYSNQITVHPIEGDDIDTDNVQRTPEELTIEGVSSDTPLREINQDLQKQALSSGRVQVVFNKLLEYGGFEVNQYNSKKLQVKKIPKILTVVTGLKVYTSMVITQLTIPRVPGSGYGLSFTVTFTKINKVNTQFVSGINLVSDKAGTGTQDEVSNTTDKGLQDKKKEPSESTLYKYTFGLFEKK